MINSKELKNRTKDLSILYVEDHDELRNSTNDILKNFFNVVDSAEDGLQGLKLYQDYMQKSEGKSYDIVLTDIKMPKMNGVELTKNIYNINPSQTLIVVSAHEESQYLLPLINLGIEQFIQKPLDYQELLKALQKASQKVINKKEETFNIPTHIVKMDNSFTYNRDTQSLLNQKENVYLTKYEIIFLQQLTENVGKIYSNEDIVDNYKALDESIDSQNIRKLISKLRKKLPEDSLESIYGIGYKFIPFYE